MLKFNILRHLPNKFLAQNKQTLFSPWLPNLHSLTKRGIQTKTQMISKYIPKTYADVNSKMPTEYWDYDNYENTWGYFF